MYYVGDQVEVDENFLGIRKPPANPVDPLCWPKGSQGTFALNGNHEMYARGYAYFDRMLPTLGPIVNGTAQVLSHHQYFSRFESKARQAIGRVLFPPCPLVLGARAPNGDL
jgi:hypothetical protein